MTKPGHKICPYCQEEILATAVKCRFCQEWLIQQGRGSGGLEALLGDLTGITVGHYQVTGHIGDGGMGSVWKGKHTSLDREVAVKVLHSQMLSHAEIVRRFLTEARAVVRLGSPHLVEILDLGVLPDGRPYYVMEYFPGTTLDAWMQQHQPVPVRDLFSIAEQTMSALAVVHERQIIHRDLKPANLMVQERPDGTLLLKLLDFGVAKCLDEAMGDKNLTRTGMTVGTPVYMSPEQAGGERNIDARSDLYSAGVLLYHLATGAPPFLDENVLAIMEMHRSTRPKPPRTLREDLPPAFETWLMKLLSKRRENRFADAEDAKEELLLARAQDQYQPTEALVPRLAPTAKKQRRRYGLLAGVCTVLTALPIGLWLWLRAPTEVPTPETFAVLPLEPKAAPEEEAPPIAIEPTEEEAPVDAPVEPPAEVPPAPAPPDNAPPKPEATPKKHTHKPPKTEKITLPKGLPPANALPDPYKNKP